MDSLQHTVQVTSSEVGTLSFLMRNELFSYRRPSYQRISFDPNQESTQIVKFGNVMDPGLRLSRPMETFFILKTDVEEIAFGRTKFYAEFWGVFLKHHWKSRRPIIMKLDHMVHSAAYHHGKRTIVTSEIGALNGILVLKFLELSAQR